MTNRRLRRVLGLLPLALVLALPAAPASASFYSANSTGTLSGPVARAAATGDCSAAESSPADVGVQQLEDAVLCLVNRERTSRGLSALRPNGILDRAARGHSRNMVQRNFFAHDSLGGATVMHRVKRRGYRSGGGLMVGENIAWGSGSYATPAEVVDGWMHSSGHRANILHRSFREIGVGVAIGAPRETHGQPAATYTTDFGTRR
jgi:uncharacterized protein YkwD